MPAQRNRQFAPLAEAALQRLTVSGARLHYRVLARHYRLRLARLTSRLEEDAQLEQRNAEHLEEQLGRLRVQQIAQSQSLEKPELDCPLVVTIHAENACLN
ncbi:hypothetical protein DFJ77DRAFT_439925 [Powellomyces hirtus]|nr:hypothetical protein DFJ77DRAFT_440657 [Powellomyces hirtus]KAI8916689.1 hypothetical protein DFJ77DRAFT_439925 [Powellomyces hirtus]